ncbi:hypothetical protein [Streptomyces sp. ODS28]|uniref:hypothetical protein n=1 Tax=Streptomyces sp. ODS28 TaxID=3136688 RepID=UPI0031EA8EA0
MTWHRYSAADRERIAAEHDAYADGLLNVARHLDAKGHTDAADIQRNTSQAAREVADAARESSDRLNEIVNG